jgi:hypothetical protein
VPIPRLNADGYLPEGIHDCSLEELGKEFGVFRSNDTRPLLYRQLEEFITALRAIGAHCSIIIDGSFVTSALRPNDIDIIVALPDNWDIQADLAPAAYNVLSKRSVRRRWRLDLLVARDGTKEYAEYVALFQQIRYLRDQRKGILRIRL